MVGVETRFQALENFHKFLYREITSEEYEKSSPYNLVRYTYSDGTQSEWIEDRPAKRKVEDEHYQF